MSWVERNKLYIVGGAIVTVIVILVVIYLVNNNANKIEETQSESSGEATNPSSENKEGFDNGIKPSLVLFHSTGCGFCKQMMPEWDKAEQILQNSGEVITMAFEASTSRDEVRRNNISGFPEIRLYLNGYPNRNFIQYKGNRSADSLVKFAMTKGQEV